MATHFSILAWKISRTEEHGGLQSMVSQRVGHDWATEHSTMLVISDAEHLFMCLLAWHSIRKQLYPS